MKKRRERIRREESCRRPVAQGGAKTPSVSSSALPIAAMRVVGLFYPSLYGINRKWERIQSAADEQFEFFFARERGRIPCIRYRVSRNDSKNSFRFFFRLGLG